MPRMTVVDGLAESLNRLHVSFGPVALVARPSVFGEMAIQFDHQSVPTNFASTDAAAIDAQRWSPFTIVDALNVR